VTDAAVKTARSGISENTIAALSYITFVPAIYFLIIPRYNRSSYIRFHAWQSLLLDVFAFLCSVILSILVLPAVHSETLAIYVLDFIRVMWGVWFGLWVVTAIAAMKGKKFKIWIIGNLAAKQAGA
jgi:uncharacterized membrane protein